MATDTGTGFKLQMLGIAGSGAKTTAPQDFSVVTTVPGTVLKDLFLQRLNHLVELGVMTQQQVKAFEQLVTDTEQGTTPTAPARPSQPRPPTPETVIRTAIVSGAARARQNGDDTSGGSFLSFLADAFITLGGGLYGAITEGSIDGFLEGAAMAQQWAEENIPAVLEVV
jgi:hypothetical protein